MAKVRLEYIKNDGECFVCKKRKGRFLKLKKTNALLCSLKCERDYWLDIFY